MRVLPLVIGPWMHVALKIKSQHIVYVPCLLLPDTLVTRVDPEVMSLPPPPPKAHNHITKLGCTVLHIYKRRKMALLWESVHTRVELRCHSVSSPLSSCSLTRTWSSWLKYIHTRLLNFLMRERICPMYMIHIPTPYKVVTIPSIHTW